VGRGRALFEVFTSALKEDYRFPILEVFVFLYATATVVFTGAATNAISGLGLGISGEALVVVLISSFTEFPLFVFVVLVLKNIAYGIGNDLDKGIIQTLFSYPMKRRSILTAKLLSSLGVAVFLFLGVQIFSLFVIVPDIISPYIGTLLLSYAGILSFPLLVAGLVLILTLLLKKGGIDLIFGVILYFGSEIFSSTLQFLAVSTDSEMPLRILAVIAPHFALQEYYKAQENPYIQPSLSVSFNDCILYMGISYALVFLVFLISYLYFERRLEK